MRKFFYTLSILAVISYGITSCDGNKNGKGTSVIFSSSSSDADEDENVADYEKTESTSAPVEEQNKSEEAPSEGLSQQVGEDLEQPAEIQGEVILFKDNFVVSYNMKTKCPNYVAWHLRKSNISGNVNRKDEFIGDFAIGDMSRVESYDYSGSGYDRGHMCPAGDNKNSDMAMTQSFMMTNICPQNHELNKGVWNDLEQQCRNWVRDYSDLYIVCGPIFDSANPRTIGKRKSIKIAVPDRFFKVVLMMGREPKAIGFIYPNAETYKDMRDYCVSVDRVEKITGFDFYPKLDDEIEKKVEKECNPSAWGI